MIWNNRFELDSFNDFDNLDNFDSFDDDFCFQNNYSDCCDDFDCDRYKCGVRVNSLVIFIFLGLFFISLVIFA